MAKKYDIFKSSDKSELLNVLNRNPKWINLSVYELSYGLHNLY
jgi:hypothetical protein